MNLRPSRPAIRGVRTAAPAAQSGRQFNCGSVRFS